MEGSLASFFLEDSVPSLPLSWATSGQSIDELQQQLVCTTSELQSATEAASVQGKHNEAELLRLQNLLETTRKERDQAHLECGKLENFLLHFSNSPQFTTLATTTSSPFSLPQSSNSSISSPAHGSHHSPTSSSLEVFSFQDLHQKSLCISTNKPQISHDKAKNMQAVFLHELDEKPSSCILVEESQQEEFSIDMLLEDQSMKLYDLQEEKSIHSTWQANQSSNSIWVSTDSNATRGALIRQSSHISSAASSQSSGGMQELEEAFTMPFHHHIQVSLSHQSLPIATFEALPMPDDVLEPHHPIETQNAAESLKSGPDIMLDALPKKGKLLEAVLQAGPLLQTLLLAGPLPEWKHPPPQLNMVDIPKVPMSPNNVTWPMAIPNYQNQDIQLPKTTPNVMRSPYDNISSLLANRVGLATFGGEIALPNMHCNLNLMNLADDLSLRGPKLRKLSSIGVR